MINAAGEPQSLLLLGGGSEIGLATALAFAHGPLARVVLAGRPSTSLEEGAHQLRAAGVQNVTTVEFDARDTHAHAAVIENAFAEGDIDVVMLAFGVLGDQLESERDPSVAVEVAMTNYVGAVSVGLHVATRLRAQGHGAMVVLSSVAGERARRANFIYGSSKAGLDAFAQGLGDALHGSGAQLLVVRPGFVRTRMTLGRPEAPFSVAAAQVAECIQGGLRRGTHTIWVPMKLRWVMALVRLLPRPIFRRISR